MDSKSGKFLTSVVVLVTVIHLGPVAAKLNCDFHDSINITAGGYYNDQDYIHNGVTYNRNQYATVDYDLVNDTKLIVAPYIRGCICLVKPCVRSCCDSDHEKSESCTTKYSGHVINVLTEEVTLVADLSEQFAFTYGMLNCQKYSLKPHEASADNYTITTVRILGKL